MPRDGSGVYALPFPDVVTATPISSTVYNGFEHDIATDLNAARPIVAGGTGANNATSALTALGGEKAGQVVANYDSFVFTAGSFFSAGSATTPPVAGHSFIGICYLSDVNNIMLEARDVADGKKYVRRKTAGTWGGWVADITATDLSPYAPLASPVFTGNPVSVTPAVDDNDTSIATTAYVIGQAGTASPAMDGSALAGSSLRWSRQDHVHPTDTSRAPLNAPIFTGNAQSTNPPLNDNDSSIATTSFVTTAVANGTSGTIKSVKVQKFTTTGTYTPSAGMLYCIIECWGAGGGGGGIASAGSGIGAGAAGGGAGSKARLIATAATIGASKAVTIGAHGTGGAVGNNAGTAGGDTSVGVLCIGKGGSGGSGSSGGANTNAAGGAGGVAGTGDVTGVGQSGGNGPSIGGSNSQPPGGSGGNSEVGAGGVTTPLATKVNGNPGLGFASGGCGAQCFNANGTASGGDGTDGLVVITEFCSQ